MNFPDLRPALDIDSRTTLLNQVILEQPFKTFATATLDGFEGGAFSYVSPGAVLVSVKIGRYCSIGNGVTILGDHPTGWLTTSPATYHQVFPPPFDATSGLSFVPYKNTVIGNDVWIGTGAMIKSGVEIGDRAVIGAGSVVTRDVPAFSIYGGVPAREIRPRFAPAIQARIQALEWWRYNLVGEALPWNDVESVLDLLESRVAAGTLVPYCPDCFSIFVEDSIIRGRPVPTKRG